MQGIRPHSTLQSYALDHWLHLFVFVGLSFREEKDILSGFCVGSPAFLYTVSYMNEYMAWRKHSCPASGWGGSSISSWGLRTSVIIHLSWDGI